MSENIQTSICYLKEKAEEIEKEIDKIDPDSTAGCTNCGFLTQENIDNDQNLRELILSLTEISEALEYLESLL